MVLPELLIKTLEKVLQIEASHEKASCVNLLASLCHRRPRLKACQCHRLLAMRICWIALVGHGCLQPFQSHPLEISCKISKLVRGVNVVTTLQGTNQMLNAHMCIHAGDGFWKPDALRASSITRNRECYRACPSKRMQLCTGKIQCWSSCWCCHKSVTFAKVR